MAQVAVCSEINTKPTNTMSAERTVVECKTWCNTRNQLALRGEGLLKRVLPLRTFVATVIKYPG